jgi:Protein of unknown function (DUF4238)
VRAGRLPTLKGMRAEADPQRGFSHSELFRDLRLIEAGRKLMPATKAKRHHFVPKLLLKRFSPRDGRIWQMDTGTGATLDVQIEKAASRRRFYEFLHNDQGVKTARMESWLSLVESHASKVLRRIEHQGPVLGLADWDRATLSFFLALLSSRTPAALKEAEALGEEAMRFMLGTKLSDPQSFARQHGKIFPESEPDAVEELRKRMLQQLEDGQIGYEDPSGEAMRRLVQGSGAVTQQIFESRWLLLRAMEGEFVTSDVALAMHDPKPEYPWSAQAWRSSPEVQVTIPLSSASCLLIIPGRAIFERFEVGREDVDEINLRTLGWSERFLFGGTEEGLIAIQRLAREKPELVVEPKPKRHVFLVELDPDDTSLADEHQRRGWPVRFTAPDETGKRRVFDYMVVGEDGTPLEVAAQATDRLRKIAPLRQGTSSEDRRAA